MAEILNIPKLYTAIAEWMAVLTAILVYRRCLRRERKELLLLGGKLAVSLILLWRIQHFCESAQKVPWFLGMAAAVFVMLLTLKFSLHLNTGAAAYLCSRVFIWAELAASLEWQIWYFYTFNRDIFISALPAFFLTVLFYLFVYLFFYLIESHELPSDVEPSKLHASSRQIFASWLISFFLFVLGNLSYIQNSSPFISSNGTDVFNIRTLSDIIGVVSIQLFHVQKREQEKNKEAAAMRFILKNQYTQFQTSRDNIEMINRKYHDLKHQLQVLRAETNDQQRIGYIQEIENELNHYESEFRTGNPALDTLLTSKQIRCLNEHITMTVVADGSLLDHMKVMDLCAVFGNALDNCIEHVLKIPEPDHRLIHLTVTEKNNFICILIENYYVGKEIKDGELPATTKKNTAYHGYGLKSIKFTIEQYGGFINTGISDHWFRLEILMPKES